jgi:hypothetical protein
MLSQCFSCYCCMESLGKLPPKRFGHHMVNVSAILRILFWGLPESWGQPGPRGAAVVSPASGPKTPAHRESANAESVRLGGGAWPLWDRPTSDVGAPPAPTRNWPATLEDAGGRSHGAQRSGSRPLNEVFALRRRTGTRQCLVVAASTGPGSYPVFRLPPARRRFFRTCFG